MNGGVFVQVYGVHEGLKVSTFIWLAIQQTRQIKWPETILSLPQNA